MEKINKKTLISAGVLFLIVVIGIISYIFSINKKVATWEDKIYPEINVYGVNIGGLSKEEAVNLLKEKLPQVIMDKKLKVLVGDKSLELTYNSLNPTYNIEEIAEEALAYGKDKGVFAKNSLIKGRKEINIDAEIKYNEEALVEFEDKVMKEFNIEPKDASIEINSGNISVTPEESGKTIDKEELHKSLIENINGDPHHEVEIVLELKEQEANIKAEDLNKITGKISSYSSNYANTGDGRVRNMEIAASIINGTIVMPGEEFSYNALIGDTTPDKGYEKANTYVGNKIVPDYGGGICQVSTTLYRAVMRANIRSTERMNHSLTVSYSEPGLDATVANPYVDYKFVNTYDFPVYIQGYVSGGVVSFAVYGNVESMGNKTYELVNEVHEKYNPEVKYEDDPTMEEGTEKVVIHGMPGYKASSYQVTYENGVEVNREFIATDVYMTTDTVIKKGTKKKEKENPKKEESQNQDQQKPNTDADKKPTE
ncbi:VanW family protein [uncultured Clostridium sp.]|uniref:VanW family protein n=1 Tax=uncultured Clostridium sp. TaxID=59620 RepID=UPI00258B675A|nr:VanW family protein [uncultured Clostridium sp.]